jgi:hypothetical protein
MEDGLKLLDHLQQACQEVGQATEPLVTSDERRTAALAAEALAAECRAAGIDTRVLLQALAQRWSELRAGVLRDDAGRAVYLPGPVSFLDFFEHRKRITDYLNANQ